MEKNIKNYILGRNENYRFKIVKINEIDEKFINLIRKNTKNDVADKKFLEKLKKVDKKILGNFIFLLRSIDFRLWEFSENWKYKKENGFFGLMERMIDLFNRSDYEKINFEIFRKIISPKENLNLTKLRFKIFKTNLRWLKKYDRNFDNYFDENKKAFDFCTNLFELEKYRDFHKNFYFLKPSQLLYLEYLIAKRYAKNYQNELETLTIFSDYKVPQIFVNFSLIKIPSRYLRKLKKKSIIKKFSLFENELRFASILLGEEISKRLKIPAYRIDNILWWLSYKIKLEIPAPKVKTIFY